MRNHCTFEAYLSKQIQSELKRIEAWKAFDKRSEKQEESFLDALRPVLDDQKDAAIKSLRKGTKTIAGALDNDFNEWDEELAKALEPEYISIATESGEAAAASVGISFDVTNEAVQDFIGAKLDAIQDINDTTVNAVHRILSLGEENGDSIDTIANSIEEYFDAADKGRAVTIARTEVIGSSNLGARAAYVQSDVVTDVEWVTQIDGRERESHNTADGQTVAIDKHFTVSGEKLWVPGDPSGSAGNVINCRCTIIPIVEE